MCVRAAAAAFCKPKLVVLVRRWPKSDAVCKHITRSQREIEEKEVRERIRGRGREEARRGEPGSTESTQTQTVCPVEENTNTNNSNNNSILGPTTYGRTDRQTLCVAHKVKTESEAPELLGKYFGFLSVALSLSLPFSIAYLASCQSERQLGKNCRGRRRGRSVGSVRGEREREGEEENIKCILVRTISLLGG